jgi:hypothetical protein
MTRHRCVCLAGLLLGVFTWSTPPAHGSERRVSKVERKQNQALRKIERARNRHYSTALMADGALVGDPTVVLAQPGGAKLVFKSRMSLPGSVVEVDALIVDRGKETRLQFIGNKLTEASRATLAEVFGSSLTRRAVKLRNGPAKKRAKKRSQKVPARQIVEEAARNWGEESNFLDSLLKPGSAIFVGMRNANYSMEIPTPETVAVVPPAAGLPRKAAGKQGSDLRQGTNDLQTLLDQAKRFRPKFEDFLGQIINRIEEHAGEKGRPKSDTADTHHVKTADLMSGTSSIIYEKWNDGHSSSIKGIVLKVKGPQSVLAMMERLFSQNGKNESQE